MQLTLQTVDLVLRILIELVLLFMLVFGLKLMKDLGEVIESAEKSAENLEDTSRVLWNIARIGEKLPFVGAGGRRDE